MENPLSRAGFVLAGGRSSRMGRDKALLEADGQSLLNRVAQAVREAAGTVALIGDPGKYGRLGYPVYPDVFTGCGPLAGIHAALRVTGAEWNIVTACDMPDLTTEFLSHLLEVAEKSGCDCLLPAGESGRPEPLCAVYRRHSLERIKRALENGTRKILDGLEGLHVEIVRVSGTEPFRNINTPEDWADYRRVQTDKTQDNRE